MKRRRRHKNSGNKDIISDLLECILLHILSFLDTKCAVTTCILSTRWKNLWKLIPSLTLHSDSHLTIKSFRRFVSWILSKRDSSTALHALDFYRDGIVEPHLFKRIVKYAVSHGVQLLQIDVTCEIQHFSSCFFSCHTLTSLDLSVQSRDYFQLTLFPNSLNLPALTSLSLHEFAFCSNDNGRVEPFSTFNRLISLFIDDCKVPDTQNLCISSVTLTNLTIQSNFILGNYRKIELCTPSLCTFVYTGNPFPKLSGNHLCPVKHLNIDAYTDSDFKNTDALVLFSWLIALTNIRSLNVSSTILQVLSLVPDLLKLKFPSLRNLKSLKVKIVPLSCFSSKALIDAKLAQLPNWSQEEVSKIKKAFKGGSCSIPDGIVGFLLQNSPSAKVHFV